MLVGRLGRAKTLVVEWRRDVNEGPHVRRVLEAVELGQQALPNAWLAQCATVATVSLDSHREAINPKKHFVTAKQLAEVLGIPEQTLRYWRNVGLGPAWHKLEGSIRYASEDVEAYVAVNSRIPSVRAFMEERHGPL